MGVDILPHATIYWNGTKWTAIEEVFDQQEHLEREPVQAGLKPVTFSVSPNYDGSPNQMLSAISSSLFSEYEIQLPECPIPPLCI